MIPPEKIDEIISRLDLVSVIQQYVSLKKAGKHYKGLCPFHPEKTPSFTVSGEKGMWKCFGCGEGGGLIQFVMKMERLEFFEAVKYLAERAGVVLRENYQEKVELSQKDILRKVLKFAGGIYHEALMEGGMGKNALNYLQKRGIDIETIKTFALGYAPGGGDHLVSRMRGKKIEYTDMEKAGICRRGEYSDYYDYFRNRLIFPIRDPQGRIIAMGGRILHEDKKQPKYINTPETILFSKRNTLYGLDCAKNFIREQDEVYVVEGYMDTIALYQAGFKNVVASMGTSLTREQAETIARYTRNIIFAYDSDTAGNMATLRGIEIFETAGLYVRILDMPPGEDPDSVLRKMGKEFFVGLKAKSRSIVDYKVEHIKNKYDLSTPEGKEEFVAEIIPILKSMQGEIRKSEYARLLCQKHNIREDIFRRELNRTRLPQKVDTAPNFHHKTPSHEEKLLYYLLSAPRFIPLCRNFHFSGEAMSENIFKLYKIITGQPLLENREHIDIQTLTRLLQNQDNLFKIAVDLSLLEGLPPGSGEEIEAILKEIEKNEMKKELERLNLSITERLKNERIPPTDRDYIRYLELLKKVKM